jgi:hypothetical protein
MGQEKPRRHSPEFRVEIARGNRGKPGGETGDGKPGKPGTGNRGQ